jgi:hypothetical protein
VPAIKKSDSAWDLLPRERIKDRAEIQLNAASQVSDAGSTTLERRGAPYGLYGPCCLSYPVPSTMTYKGPIDRSLACYQTFTQSRTRMASDVR